MKSFFSFFCLLLLSQSFVLSAQAGPRERYKNLELFQKVLHFVENNYVDTVDNEKLIFGAIKGMLETLDPHSNFLPPRIFSEMKSDTSGEYGGLGIEIGMKEHVLTVIAPIEDSPAWKAGIKAGDRIVEIDGDSTKGKTLSEVISQMRGKNGTVVKLTIFRQGFDEAKVFGVQRSTIKVKSVKQEMIEPGFGYVRLASFNEKASQEIKKAIDLLERNGKLKGLVLDLRTNPGGLLDQAVDVSSLFIDEGVIVSTIGRDENQKEIRHAKKGRARKDFPLAILVNSSTASAAEIVAGALQDLNRAVIIGQPTFGKGSVQTVIELGEKMGLKLTIARYYTASGRSIQEKGVIPDIMIDQYDPDLLDKAKVEEATVREKDLPGHLKGKNIEKHESFTKAEMQRMVNQGALAPHLMDSQEKMGPKPTNPQKDFEVLQAMNYLKSFEVFRKLQDQRKKEPIHIKRGATNESNGSSVIRTADI